MSHLLRSRPVGSPKQKGENSKLGSSRSASPAKALRLAYCDESGVFKMDAEAVVALQLVKGPLGVVSVCGRARQGKSFILNQLLGRSSGFQVASTHRPCTKGLWMWSAPLKKIAPDGTEYSLLLLDSEGIDAYDQTGTYSTQIFSMAVLLSSMFIYNQMGGIDEAALDRLSLVTEMTKHIRVRATEHRPSSAELGQFSPIFLWLLRDFYLDLIEDGQRITPRDYLESALQPLPAGGKDIAAKNEIRDSIRTLFPDRACFTLVRPLNEEHDLQRLDQIPLERMRPEFRGGLDALTKFIFDRTKPKQVGSTIMTGPLLAGVTQSFLDAINAGAVPTIATSWQNVEESECRRAYDTAMEAYAKTFNLPASADEEMVRETQEGALEQALGVYNSEAVGAGATRYKYEKILLASVKRHFEENMRKMAMEAEVNCAKAVERMDEKLRAACHPSTTTLDQALEVLNNLVVEYEQTAFGPAKWKKLVKFLQHSLEGPLLDITKRWGQENSAEIDSLRLRCRSLEDKLSSLEKQLDGAKKEAQEWKRRYEAIAADSKSSAEAASVRYVTLQRSHNSMEEKFTSQIAQLEASRKEASDWRTKYEHLMSERKAEEKQMRSDMVALQSRCSAAEGKLSAVREQLDSAKEEAAEWRRKHEAIVEEFRISMEKATAMYESISKQAQSRQDALRADFASAISVKEKELKDTLVKLEKKEVLLAGLQAHIEGLETKLNMQEEELVVLRSEARHFQTLVDAANATALSREKELNILKHEKIHLEERLSAELKRLEEAEMNCRVAEKDAKAAGERAERAQDEAALFEREKLDGHRLAAERLAALERAERRSEGLARERDSLSTEVAGLQLLEQEGVSKIQSLERQLLERENEMGVLLDSANEQRAKTIEVLESLLKSERQACTEANLRAEDLSVKLQITQGKLDSLQQQFSTARYNETMLDGKLRLHHGELGSPGVSVGKRLREDDNGHGEAVKNMGVGNANISSKKRQCVETGSPVQGLGKVFDKLEDNNSSEDSKGVEDYMKLTVPKLKQELTNAGYVEELLHLRNPTKKDILTLYERLVLRK